MWPCVFTAEHHMDPWAPRCRRLNREIFLLETVFGLSDRPYRSQILATPAPVLSMESSAVLTLSQLPYFSPQKSNRKRASPSWPCQPRSSQPTRLHCQKMYVPGGYTVYVFMCIYVHIYLCLW